MSLAGAASEWCGLVIELSRQFYEEVEHLGQEVELSLTGNWLHNRGQIRDFARSD